MPNIKKFISNLLKEAIEQPKVEDAIKKHYEVMLYYDADGAPSGKGKRIIQPTTLGISKAGNLVVRAYQPNGDTKTSTPHWKMFNLNKIVKWQPINRIFNEPPDFNPNGDNSMQQVLLNATFNGLSRDRIMRNIEISDEERRKRMAGRNKGNAQSIEDMSKSKDFGNESTTQTVGPVRKGEASNVLQNVQDKEVDYSRAMENGPKYKDNELDNKTKDGQE